MYWWLIKNKYKENKNGILIKIAKKAKKNKKVAEPTPVAKIKTSLNLIYKISNYIKLKEFKTDKEVNVNVCRVLYINQINEQKSLFVINSVYKIFVSVSLENLCNK